jgi:outer membrane protein TolC
MPPVPVVPASYSDSLSGETIASLPLQQFFTDPYLLQLIDSVLKNNPDLGIALQQV